MNFRNMNTMDSLNPYFAISDFFDILSKDCASLLWKIFLLQNINNNDISTIFFRQTEFIIEYNSSSFFFFVNKKRSCFFSGFHLVHFIFQHFNWLLFTEENFEIELEENFYIHFLIKIQRRYWLLQRRVSILLWKDKSIFWLKWSELHSSCVYRFWSIQCIIRIFVEELSVGGRQRMHHRY
jgi:hypothetical protein